MTLNPRPEIKFPNSVAASPNERFLFSIEETRVALGNVSRSTIYSLLSQGALEAVKIGSRNLVTVASIRGLIEQRRVRSKGAAS